jgi:hypothetical protein
VIKLIIRKLLKNGLKISKSTDTKSENEYVQHTSRLINLEQFNIESLLIKRSLFSETFITFKAKLDPIYGSKRIFRKTLI